jgi:hypothetical protein
VKINVSATSNLSLVSMQLSSIVDDLVMLSNVSNQSGRVPIVNQILVVLNNISQVSNISTEALNGIVSVYDKFYQQPTDFYTQYSDQNISPK